MINTYKYIHFKKADRQFSQIVFCKAETQPDKNWKKCKDSEIDKLFCKEMFTGYIGDTKVKYFGYR